MMSASIDWNSVAFGVIALSAIALFFALLHSVAKMRWKRAAILLIVAVVAFGAFVIVPFGGRGEKAPDSSLLFDAQAALGKPVFRFDSVRAFNGDGSSLAVYELPGEIRQKFAAADARMLSSFPRLSGSSADWKATPWRAGALTPELAEYLDSILSFQEPGGKPAELKTRIESLRSVLGHDDCYYALFQYPANGMGNVRLFAVDLKTGLFYLVEWDT